MNPCFKMCALLLLIAARLGAQNETGGLLWRQALGGAVLSLPSVQAQSVVVALDGGSVRAYSASGSPMWSYSARGRISPFVTRSREGTSYFSRVNGTLIALNRSGRELWRRETGAPLAAPVIVGWDGRLFVPLDKMILCFTASGNLLWERTFESPFSIAPKADRDGGLILALENNAVYRLDPYGGAHVWMLAGRPAVLLSTGRQQILALYPDGSMEIPGAAEEWFMSAQGDTYSALLPRLPTGPIAAVSTADGIAAVLDDGRIVSVSLDERRILWYADTHIREVYRGGGSPDPEVEMFSDQRGIYVMSKNGASGFTHDGGRLWFTLLQNAASVPAFSDDGVLYSGGTDWILYAYRIEDRALPSRGGLYGPAPEGSYGTGRPQLSFMPDIWYFEDEIRAKLEQIEAAVNAGRVGIDEPAWATFLLTVSAGREPIQFRLAALRLLGRIGSRETVPWLVDIFRRESEPSVKAAAASAIGAIGVDPDGVAVQAFLNTVIQGTERSGLVLTAVASATGALCRFSGPPLSQTGIRILNLLSAGSQPPMARQQAQRELASLR